MLDKLFFTLENVRQVRKVSKNIDNFEVIAREVQINYVERLIGSDLYAALQDDLIGGFPQQERFVELLEGVRYEHNSRVITFRGLKDYCCYVFIYLDLLEGGLQVTPIGAQMFVDEEAKAANNSQQFRQMRDHCIQVADNKEEGIVHFLENSVNFEEFDRGRSEEPARNSNFSFKAFGCTNYVPTNIFDRR